MLTWVDREKFFDKLQQIFIIKVLERLALEETNFKLIKATYDKHPKWRKGWIVPIKIRNEAELSMVLTPFQYSAPSTLWSNEAKK